MDTSVLLINILISFACGVVANLGTPAIRGYLIKGIFGSRKAKIRKIKADIELIESYLNNPKALHVYLFGELFRVAFWFILGIALLLLSSPLNILKWALQPSFVFIGLALGAASSNVTVLRTLLSNPQEHREKLLAKLAMVEGKALPAKPANG